MVCIQPPSLRNATKHQDGLPVDNVSEETDQAILSYPPILVELSLLSIPSYPPILVELSLLSFSGQSKRLGAPHPRPDYHAPWSVNPVHPPFQLYTQGRR